MSDRVLHEYSTYKIQAFDVFMNYANAFNSETEEDVEIIKIENLERNFLKLFGILI